MEKTRSKDGTTIAFDRIGSGPPLILVDGAMCHRAFGPSAPLARLLAAHFTVLTYDRRGRGDSGDAVPYAVEREVEDVAALIREVGGSAFVFGISSGAALALEAAKRGLRIPKVAVFEAPFIVDDSRSPVTGDYTRRLGEHIAAGRRGAAVKMFMREAVRVPAIFVALMRLSSAWAKLEAVAPTLAYDTALVVDNERGEPLRSADWAGVTVPTLVLDGGKSPAWMRNAMASLAANLPAARYQTLPGQTHMVKPEVLAPCLVEFFLLGTLRGSRTPRDELGRAKPALPHAISTDVRAAPSSSSSRPAASADPARH